ncbi:MAG: hypothetical protein QW797_08350 [Thermoproteota archaeon]
MFEELAEALKRALEDESGYKFELQDIVDEKKVNYKKLLRKYDLESLPTILKLSQKGTIGLGEYYNLWGWPHKEIDWEKDWKDDNPVFIDYVEVWPNKVLIGTSGEFMLDFMAHKYYGLGEIILEPRSDIYVNKEDKMKLARYMPAVIKDVEIALKAMSEVSTANGFDTSGFKFFFQPWVDFCVKSEHPLVGIKEEEIVENCIRRVKVMSEWRKRFRAWLPSMERKHFYENTKIGYTARMLKKGNWWSTGVEGLIKWPVKDRKIREKVIRNHIYRYLDHGAHLFTLDGYGIIGYRIDHEYKFKFWVDRRQKKFQRLKPIPLEKIGFLREDFPEMFKE